MPVEYNISPSEDGKYIISSAKTCNPNINTAYKITIPAYIDNDTIAVWILNRVTYWLLKTFPIF